MSITDSPEPCIIRLIGWKFSRGIEPRNGKCGHCGGTLQEDTEDLLIGANNTLIVHNVDRISREFVCFMCSRRVEYKPIFDKIAPDEDPMIWFSDTPKRGRPTKKEAEFRRQLKEKLEAMIAEEV
jgi:hypothetical protein